MVIYNKNFVDSAARRGYNIKENYFNKYFYFSLWISTVNFISANTTIATARF